VEEEKTDKEEKKKENEKEWYIQKGRRAVYEKRNRIWKRSDNKEDQRID
jgi:hypothetical protein